MLLIYVALSLQFVNKNTFSTLVYDQGANCKSEFILKCWERPFFLLNCFSKKIICLCVYDTLGTMEDSILHKVEAGRCVKEKVKGENIFPTSYIHVFVIVPLRLCTDKFRGKRQGQEVS